MKIIESSIIGKKSPEACEDGMVVTDDRGDAFRAEPDLYGYRWIPDLSGGSEDCSLENETCFK